MGNSKLEKIYAVCVFVILWTFFGSIMLYLVQHHKIVKIASNTTSKIKINWAERYPFVESEDKVTTYHEDKYVRRGIHALKEEYLSAIDDFKVKTNKDASENFFGRESLILAAYGIRQRLQWPWMAPKDFNVITELANGYLVETKSAVSDEELEKIVSSIVDFKNFLSAENISFIYVNAGDKINPQDSQLSDALDDFSNANANNLLQALQDRSVDTLDFRAEILNAGLDWYKVFYVADHHWTTVAQLWAASVLADKLNRDYGFHFDLSCFDKNNYNCTVYEKIFLGSYGRRKVDLRYLEDYEMLLPKFDTEFEIDIPTRNIHRTGDYNDTIIDFELLEKIKNYFGSDFLVADAYSITQIRNEALTTILNKKQSHNGGKKILMIQDSFGMYLAGYLAMDIPEMNIIYLPNFSGSIRTYIRQTRPDIVILMYCVKNINTKPIDWAVHSSPFDLR